MSSKLVLFALLAAMAHFAVNSSALKCYQDDPSSLQSGNNPSRRSSARSTVMMMAQQANKQFIFTRSSDRVNGNADGGDDDEPVQCPAEKNSTCVALKCNGKTIRDCFGGSFVQEVTRCFSWLAGCLPDMGSCLFCDTDGCNREIGGGDDGGGQRKDNNN